MVALKFCTVLQAQTRPGSSEIIFPRRYVTLKRVAICGVSTGTTTGYEERKELMKSYRELFGGFGRRERAKQRSNDLALEETERRAKGNAATGKYVDYTPRSTN